MSLSLQNLRDEVRQVLGNVDTDDLSNTDLDLMLNLSWWELAAKVNWREIDGEATLATANGVRNYTLSAITSDFHSIRRVSILQANTTEATPLLQAEYEELFDKRDDSTEARGTPSQYARFRGDIVFYPVPDSSYTVRIHYRRTLADLEASGPPVPQEWHEIIMLGAAARAFRRFNDFEKSQAMNAERNSLIATTKTVESKEQSDFHEYAGARLLRRGYVR